jgi:hypothetical protein
MWAAKFVFHSGTWRVVFRYPEGGLGLGRAARFDHAKQNGYIHPRD